MKSVIRMFEKLAYNELFNYDTSNDKQNINLI